MKINILNPTDFINVTLNANERTDFVLPVLSSLTAETFVIVDQTNRSRFVTGDKFDLSFVSDLQVGFDYLNGELVEDVDLEEINVNTSINNGNTITLTPSVYEGVPEQNALRQFGDLIGTELLTLDTLSLSRVGNKVNVELLSNPYFTGKFSIPV